MRSIPRPLGVNFDTLGPAGEYLADSGRFIFIRAVRSSDGRDSLSFVCKYRAWGRRVRVRTVAGRGHYIFLPRYRRR